MTDQQHSGMMSCTGNTWLNTPAMDRLASEGIRFERAYSSNPVCVPSRIAMATGTMPGRLAVFGNGDLGTAVVPAVVNENSLGKLIKRAGYDTFYGGKVHMCKELVPQTAGYDEYFRDEREELPDACIGFIRKKRSRPFFALASFINPHDICYAHTAYLSANEIPMQGKNKKNNKPRTSNVQDLYDAAAALPLDKLPPIPANYPIPDGEPEAIEGKMNPNAVTPAGTMRKEYGEREWRINRWIYHRLTERVDGHIGKILAALDDAGLADNTLVLFTSDHGNMDASHRLASKGLFYEESVRVPCLMKYTKAIPAGQVDTRHAVSTGLDILPTLSDYAGVAVPKSLMGKSLRPVAEGQPVNWRSYVVSENDTGRMVRSDRFKYCVYVSGTQRESLADLQADPGEMKNLAKNPEYTGVVEEHRSMLNDWIATSGDTEAKEFIF
jgi:choline-sulfatase